MIKVGCCGWAVKGGMTAYFQRFNVIEIQSTFYSLPLLSAVESRKDSAPQGFEFAMKAWQAITHPISSPTWKKAGLRIHFEDPANVGNFRPTEENFRAWRGTKEIYQRLGASVCMLQSPPSFRCTSDNISNICSFLMRADRGGMVLGWEPRGDWNEHRDVISDICNRFNLVRVVDPFGNEALTRRGPLYFRLHGIGRREVNYGYRYTDGDLHRLVRRISKIELKDRDIYVMFNNISMAADALRFREMLSHTPTGRSTGVNSSHSL